MRKTRSSSKTQIFGTPDNLKLRAQDTVLGDDAAAFAEAIVAWNKVMLRRYRVNSQVVMAAKLGDVNEYLERLG